MSQTRIVSLLKTHLITLQYYLVSWPKRCLRLFFHIINVSELWKPQSVRAVHYRSPYMHRFWVYGAECLVLILDILGVPELASAIIHTLHLKNQPLNPRQKEIIHSVFGNEIKLKYIMIDTNGRWFAKQHVLAFVSFNIIHFNVEWTEKLLIHEATHVWQYQRFGSVYIIRALLGQRSVDGYNYGGKEGIEKWLRNGKINDINYEQQAEIITDYYDKIVKNAGDIKISDKYNHDDMYNLVQKLLGEKYS